MGDIHITGRIDSEAGSGARKDPTTLGTYVE